MKKNIFKFTLLVVILLSTQFSLAGGPGGAPGIPSPGGGPGGPPGVPPGGSGPGGPPGFPIDGGVLFLSAVAFGYGIKKIKDSK